ncbi:MAG TPA: hypothetical protein VMH81_19670 [Bryobacteraceae bacterium]|nr:hypothetical protein [Bryobacteraceae bacterium]
MQICSIALQGLNQAQAQFDKAGKQLAFQGENSTQGGDTAQLSDAAVSLLSGKNTYQAGLKLAKAADEMEREAVNLLA